MQAKLYMVTDRLTAGARPLVYIVEQAVQGGVGMVQLREKDLPDDEFCRMARTLVRLLKQYRIPLIINDRPDIALKSGAQGLHIGQNDLSYPEARRIMGSEAIIGLSVESASQAEEANGWKDLDYVAASPVFVTPRKKELTRPLGLTGLAEIVSLTRHPCYAIGGINKSNVQDIIRVGAKGVAVIAAIVAAKDPQAAAREMIKKIEEAKKNACL